MTTNICLWHFCQLAIACYMERIDLSAHGFYVTPISGFDWNIGQGNPFKYFTYGAAFAEVEIDTLTGDFHTRRADVFLDLGFSLNPAIDVGQVILSSAPLLYPAVSNASFSFNCNWSSHNHMEIRYELPYLEPMFLSEHLGYCFEDNYWFLTFCWWSLKRDC